MKTKGFLLLAFLFGLFLNVQAADNVNGNGTLSTKTIKIDDFNEVRIDGIMDFSYVQSDDPGSLEVTLDENLHQYLNVDIHDRILTLSFDKKVKVGKLTKFVVKTNSKWLKKVKAAGNANFMVNSKLSGDELEVKAKEEEMSKLKGETLDINFGSQIRSYIMHPYSLVKDHRTNVEETNVNKVLDGDIDKFISANLRRNVK